MRARLLVLAALTLLSGWLRFTAAGFGLPGKFRPDEEYVLSRALGASVDWNPHFAIYPAAHGYVLHGVLRTWAALTGREFATAYAADGQAEAWLVARRVSAALGTATVPAIYLATAPAFGTTAGLVAAAIVATTPLHARDSKFATTDIAAVFWLTLAIAATLRVVRRGALRDSLASGLLAGLAIATKYPAGAVLVAVGAAHVGARWREGRTLWRSLRDIRPWLALWAAVAAFACATPSFFLDWQQTLADFDYQSSVVAAGVHNPQAGHGWSWLLLHVLPDGFGLAPALLFAAGLALAVLRPAPGTLSLASFVVVACAGIASSRSVFYRYALIPLPGMAILAGRAFALAAGAIQRRAPAGLARRAVSVVLVAGLAALLAAPLVRSWKANRLLARRDTRELARVWIESNVPAGSSIAATDAGTPYGKPQLGGDRPLVELGDPATLRERSLRFVLSDSSPLAYYSRGPSEAEQAFLDAEADLRFEVDPLEPGTPAPVFDQADAFYVPLRHIASVDRPGPRIRIWEIRPR